MKAFVDLHSMPEDKRIELIGHTVMSNPHGTMGFVVEDHAKADRYLSKLQQQFPRIQLIDRTVTVAACILVRIRRADA